MYSKKFLLSDSWYTMLGTMNRVMWLAETVMWHQTNARHCCQLIWTFTKSLSWEEIFNLKFLSSQSLRIPRNSTCFVQFSEWYMSGQKREKWFFPELAWCHRVLFFIFPELIFESEFQYHSLCIAMIFGDKFLGVKTS